MKQYNKPRKSHAFFGLGFVETIPSLRLGFLRSDLWGSICPGVNAWQVLIT